MRMRACMRKNTKKIAQKRVCLLFFAAFLFFLLVLCCMMLPFAAFLLLFLEFFDFFTFLKQSKAKAEQKQSNTERHRVKQRKAKDVASMVFEKNPQL